jgi:hypothetical protein
MNKKTDENTITADDSSKPFSLTARERTILRNKPGRTFAEQDHPLTPQPSTIIDQFFLGLWGPS